MSEGILGAIIGVVGTLLGTAIGFILSEISARQRQKAIEQQQGNALRVLLEFEINHNLILFRNFWTPLPEREKKTIEKGNAPYDDAQVLSKLISHATLPKFKYKVWDTQMTLIATTLLPKHIQHIQTLYYLFDNVERLHQDIREIDEKMNRHPFYAEPFIEVGEDFRKCADQLVSLYPFTFGEVTSGERKSRNRTRGY